VKNTLKASDVKYGVKTVLQPIYRATHTFIHDVDITQVYVF